MMVWKSFIGIEMVGKGRGSKKKVKSAIFYDKDPYRSGELLIAIPMKEIRKAIGRVK